MAHMLQHENDNAQCDTRKMMK